MRVLTFLRTALASLVVGPREARRIVALYEDDDAPARAFWAAAEEAGYPREETTPR